tara:strand:+ start:5988 stop:6197 length:210 start_codon:yes stop_codon:yes gene_type:complete
MATRDKSRITQDSEIARFYLDQIIMYEKIGIGNETANNTIITKSLIRMCEERFLHFALKAHKREIEYDE